MTILEDRTDATEREGMESDLSECPQSALPEPNSRNGCRPDPLFFLLAVPSTVLIQRFAESLSCNQLRQLDL